MSPSGPTVRCSGGEHWERRSPGRPLEIRTSPSRSCPFWEHLCRRPLYSRSVCGYSKSVTEHESVRGSLLMSEVRFSNVGSQFGSAVDLDRRILRRVRSMASRPLRLFGRRSAVRSPFVGGARATRSHKSSRIMYKSCTAGAFSPRHARNNRVLFTRKSTFGRGQGARGREEVASFQSAQLDAGEDAAFALRDRCLSCVTLRVLTFAVPIARAPPHVRHRTRGYGS